jgi:hypothetical protein
MDHQLAEKECAALATLFQQIIVDMKVGLGRSSLGERLVRTSALSKV